ncbi:unnamed protein product [Cuscuta campestris]|uniref:Uncharacterized protein n=1 Tax=Cuscuta campestris TaxID=132261 RepID=A0A484KJA3_9ASTE|nr:unnamed protein product [Cuscuta campestris]
MSSSSASWILSISCWISATHPYTGYLARALASSMMDFIATPLRLGSICLSSLVMLLTPKSRCALWNMSGWSAGKYGASGQSDLHRRLWEKTE